jgi:hypothetical protein
MTRGARRTALLVVFSLLTSAATASAEGAWVLWSPRFEGPDFKTARPTGEFSIFQAYASRNECQAELFKLDTNVRKEPAKPGQSARFVFPTRWTRAGRRGSETSTGVVPAPLTDRMVVR